MSGASRYASKMRSQRRNRNMSLEDRMAQILDDLTDFTPAWEVVGQVWSERETHVFATASSGRWSPLSGATLRDKYVIGAPREMLVRTGHLRSALTNPKPRAMGPRFAVYGPPVGTPAEVIEVGTHHAKGHHGPRRQPVPLLTTTERRDVISIMRWRLLPPEQQTKDKAVEMLGLAVRMRLGL